MFTGNVAQAKSIPEKLMDVVAEVNRSSGIIIHSDEDITYILTAYHTINQYFIRTDKGVEQLMAIPIRLHNPTVRDKKGDIIKSFVKYQGKAIAIDSKKDLALIAIRTKTVLPYRKIAKHEPLIGNTIYLAANPNGQKKTFTKGVLSNKDALVFNELLWQVDGGIIYGASGGGAFNRWGNFVGVIRAVETYKLPGCIAWKMRIKDRHMAECYAAIPYIGFIVPLPDVKEFLLKTKLEVFDYLKVEDKDE